MISPRHSISRARRPSSTSAQQAPTLKFPDFSKESSNYSEDEAVTDGAGPLPNLERLRSNEHWQARRAAGLNGDIWSNGSAYTGGTRHGRQKSLSEAIRTVRTRRGSVSQNAHEIAGALKAPVSLKLVVRTSSVAPIAYKELTVCKDPLQRLVRYLYPQQYLLQGDPYCIS